MSPGFSGQGQAGSRLGGIRAGQTISVAGQRTNFNHYTLDGVENTDPNFNTFIVMPSIDALQEFKVQTGVYPAEFGRQTTQINVLTKSGTNQYHGTAFEFLRNDKLDATQYAFTALRPVKNPFKWNQYGFTLGGPVWLPKVFNGKNKLFFMANYEAFRKRESANALYSLAPAAFQTGDFSALLPWQGHLRSQHPRSRGRWKNHHRHAVRRQHHSGKQDRSDLQEIPSAVLRDPHIARRNQQLFAGSIPAGESRSIHLANGLCGIAEIDVGRPL